MSLTELNADGERCTLPVRVDLSKPNGHRSTREGVGWVAFEIYCQKLVDTDLEAYKVRVYVYANPSTQPVDPTH